MIKNLKLDRESAVPLHLQIEQVLRRMLQQPEYRQGALLPTEVVLVEQLRVSRNTLRAALTRLESEGLLERMRKVGTRVARKKPHTSLSEWHSFTEEMRKQGIAVENFELTVSRERAGKVVGAGLDIDPMTDVWRLRRVRGWDSIPVTLAISWLHPSLELTGQEDFRQPLYQIVRHASDVTPAISREEISAITADAAIAHALGVGVGHSILLRKRVVLDAAERPIEYNLNYYRTDRYTLTLDMATSSH